jgi:hypothetical protein
MPIGAALGGAAIAGVGTVAAGAMGASATRHAVNSAADTSLATTNANNALFRETRGQNLSIAAPFYNNGVAAGNALTELLLGPQATAGNTAVPGTPGGGALDAYLAANPDVAAEARRVTSDGEFGSPQEYAAWHYQHYGQAEGRPAPAVNVPAPTAPGTGSTGALDAFDRFRQGTNYQWRYNQGLKATEGNFATRGALDSGAAEKAKITFGQNLASGELSNYMNLLASQQASGLSAAGAVMGVNTSYAGNVTAQNTNAGNVAANAALAGGQANANMWGTVGNAAGQLGGALFQYGMGQMQTPQVPSPQSINVSPTGTSNYFAGRGF